MSYALISESFWSLAYDLYLFSLNYIPLWDPLGHSYSTSFVVCLILIS